MSKSRDFSPYQGRITWSHDSQQWTIKVTGDGGGGIAPKDVFQAPVLANHLRRAGVKDVQASNDSRDYVCLVWRMSPGDLHKHGTKLLRVLKTHYSQFKGLPIKWTVQ